MKKAARFPHVSCRRGAAGVSVPVVRGTGIRVQTLVMAARQWGCSIAALVEEYSLTEAQVRDALAFYEAHRRDVDQLLAEEERLAGAPAIA